MSDRQRLVETVRAELERVDPDRGGAQRLRELVDESSIDMADVLDDLSGPERLDLFGILTAEQQAAVIEEADEEVQDFFLEALQGDARLPAILGEVAPDVAADLVDELSESRREELLGGLDEDRAEMIRELASYAPDTAGGLMTTEFVAVPESLTVRGVKDRIREHGNFESIDNIFVTQSERLLGVFSARELILAENEQCVGEIMTRDVIHVEVDDDAEEIYRVMENYHLSSIPVVDTYHNLVGLITVDDVLTVGEAEASEDVFRMAGSAQIHPTRDSVLGRARKRLPYLLVSVFGGFGSALVLRAFGRGESVDEIMYFLPLITMLGGNIATQSSAVIVRGFATGEVDPSRTMRVIIDELFVGLTVGMVVAVLGGAMAYVVGLKEPERLAVTVLLTIVSLSTLSSLLGTTIPSICERLDVDPAISAGPFITTLIDVIGCAVYMLLVVALLPR